MKRIIIALVFTISIFAVQAKEKDSKTNNDAENTAAVVISGNVADKKSGEALVGVEVKIEGTDMKTYTDFDGNFSFNNLKPGEYKVVTSYISYQKKTDVVNISSKENNLKVKLEASN